MMISTLDIHSKSTYLLDTLRIMERGYGGLKQEECDYNQTVKSLPIVCLIIGGTNVSLWTTMHAIIEYTYACM